ncbi:MAG: hypothetical protein AB8H79_23925 [Myxococcota bacterium]
MHRLTAIVVTTALVGCANALPSVTLDAPTDPALYADLPIAVSARVTDDNHDRSELIVRWISDRDGLISGPQDIDESGNIAGELSLSPGLHVLSIEVEDPREDIVTASVALDVAATNTPPKCRFTSPSDGLSSLSGSTIEIGVEVGDVDIGAQALTVALSSDLDGDLGALEVDADGLATMSRALSDGTHRLSLSATDELGALCETSLLYTLGNPPSVQITSPGTGFIEDIGEMIALSGLVSDDTDAPADLVVEWRTDAIGVLWTRPSDESGTVVASTDTLPRGPHRITLRATDSDGFYSEDSIELLVNGPPTAPVVRLAEGPATDEPLVAEIVEASTDAEGDTLTTTYAWYLDDVLVPDLTEATVPAERTLRDQAWRVEVWAGDGRLEGERGVASTGIVNTAPIVDSVALSPTSPMTNDVVSAAVESSDLDMDTVSYAFEWSVNGTVVAGASGPSLDGASYFDKGDTVSVSVTPSDDALSGAALASTAVTVINSPPSLPEVAIDPTWTFGDEDASCVIVEDAVDADGDTVTYTITWEGDGTAYPSGFTGADGPDTVFETDDTVPAADQDLADSFTCSVTATDGTAATTAVEASFDIADYTYTMGYWREFSWTSSVAPDYLIGHPVVVTKDVTVVELGIIAKKAKANSKIALYTDVAGQPSALVVGSGLQGITVGHNTFSVPATKIAAGTYWLMVVSDSIGYHGANSSKNTVYVVNMSASAAFPTSLGAPWSYSGYRHNYFMTVFE